MTTTVSKLLCSSAEMEKEAENEDGVHGWEEDEGDCFHRKRL